MNWASLFSHLNPNWSHFHNCFILPLWKTTPWKSSDMGSRTYTISFTFVVQTNKEATFCALNIWHQPTLSNVLLPNFLVLFPSLISFFADWRANYFYSLIRMLFHVACCMHNDNISSYIFLHLCNSGVNLLLLSLRSLFLQRADLKLAMKFIYDKMNQEQELFEILFLVLLGSVTEWPKMVWCWLFDRPLIPAMFFPLSSSIYAES